MAVPARKTSKTRKRMRRTHYKLTVPGMSACPNCGELRKSHYVCPSCGFYDGKEVVKVNN
ncbi:50S ribosomal protein L32 [Dellaglioa sp. BT-FLS60]|uniref:Large ribosomal subunit protein bL32 n=2 Tax=Dellaglioa TaxID=2767880 RepID=A0A2C8EKS3_9LACO|nr:MULTISPECIES: 50S ribosomal protein L32 [Dellaglioa]MCZ2491094.1 50S ribosomal protein L32 [Dellaglioa carnosa]MCZ2492740.1 50S ribosomal protein L32 [Dellaglioa carnosa]MCZ2494172.1 50S ribosomal protein L32 [Dellaglioa carnosa]MDK1716708.1 50S ribosomal protein L32 [Dellaglioa algida]MDK1718526.1 50S ribosomal protein L32 [Dellaglioa algida]